MGSRGRQATSAAPVGLTKTTQVACNKPPKHFQEFRRAHQQQTGLANERIGLLISSSDNLESFSTSHSSIGPADNNISYLHQSNQTRNSTKHPPQALKYINNDGAIFALGPNLPHQIHHQQQQQPGSFRFGVSNKQQASLESVDSSPKSFSCNQVRQLASVRPAPQPEAQLAAGRIAAHQAQLSSAERHQLLIRRFKQEAERRNLDPNRQFEVDPKSKVVAKKQTPTMNNHHSDQTYDSLTPDSFGNCKHHQHQHQHQHHQQAGGFFVDQQDEINRQQQQQVCGAIPEEASDNGNYTNEEEAELLLPESQLVEPRLQRARRVAPGADRKSQLDNLHYATVTAAALLNATANAAAAIAATEKQFSKINQPSVYSDHYQEVRRQQRQQSAIKQQLANSSVNKFRPAPRQPLPAIYANAYEQAGSVMPPPAAAPPVERKPAASTSALYGIQPTNRSVASKPNQLYNPDIFQNQQLLQAAHQQPAKVRNHAELIRQHHQHQRLLNYQHQQLHALAQLRHQAFLAPHHQQHQEQQQQQPPPAALAMVHHGPAGKNNSAKADLIGRMLMNNLMAVQQQQRAAAGSSATPAEHYAVGLADRNRFLFANNPKIFHANNPTSELLSRQLNFGLHPSNQQRDKSIYAAPGAIFAISGHPAAGIAASDSSGSSNVPLVVKKRTSFIERICRIDLTLFWWSLLIVSLFFMSIVIAISRYIF